MFCTGSGVFDNAVGTIKIGDKVTLNEFGIVSVGYHSVSERCSCEGARDFDLQKYANFLCRSCLDGNSSIYELVFLLISLGDSINGGLSLTLAVRLINLVC